MSEIISNPISFQIIIWLFTCILLVFLMQGGFLLLETGLVRSKNSINVATKNTVDFVIAMLIFWIVGYGLFVGESFYGFFGTSYFLFREVDNYKMVLHFIYQSTFCATAVTIVSGALAERIYSNAYIKIIFLLTIFAYPVMAHWVWNEAGWLYLLGFKDYAGSTVVHSVGGWASLIFLMQIGYRKGRFDNRQSKLQASNIPLACFGCFILWVGWFGFNGGGASDNFKNIPLILFNTHLSGILGGAGALAIYMLRYRHVDPISLIIGTLSGLVAVTASCNLMDPYNAAMISFISGALSMLGVWFFEKCKIDDPVSAIAVHLIGGVWGTLALALFGDTALFPNDNSRLLQLGIQAIGVGACGLFTIIISYIGYKIFNFFTPMRVTEQEEDTGLNITEHKVSTEIYDFYRVLNQQAEEQENHVVYTEIGALAKNYKNRLERDLNEKTQSLRNFLQLTQQGFLSFGNDFSIDIGYSEECKKIFEIGELEGMHFGKLLYSNNQLKKKDWINSLNLFFHSNKKSKIIFKLLDDTLLWEKDTPQQKELQLQYKEISEKKVLCIITDLTAKKKLEKQVQSSTDYQKKLLKVVCNNRFFGQFFDNAKDLLLFYKKSIQDEQFLAQPKNLSNLYLRTHDLKANMGFFGFDNSLLQLHDMESIVLNVIEKKSPLNKRVFNQQAKNIEATFNKEMNFFKNSLGEEWFENFDSLIISTENVKALQKLVKDAYPKDKKLFQKISFLKIKPFIKLVSSLKQLALDVAYQLDKKIKPLSVKISKDLVVSNEIAKPLLRIFPHIIRNMVDHGIEKPENRIELRKEMHGQLTFSAEEQTLVNNNESRSYYLFTFSDDGRGIDLEKIKELSIKRGLLKENNNPPDPKVLISHIFNERFSTKEKETTISGRGVGLSSLKKEVYNLQGKISIKTKLGHGTTLFIKIPQLIF